MKKCNIGLRTLSLLLTAALLCPTFAAAADTGTADWDDISYEEYRTQGLDGTVTEAEPYTFRVKAADALSAENATVEGETLLCPADSRAAWTIRVPEDGYYRIRVCYQPVAPDDGFDTAMERRLLVNGELPFKQASFLSFPRQYTGLENIETDLSGHDVRPALEEVEEWTTYTLCLPDYDSGDMLVHFKQGENTIALEGVKGVMRLSWLEISGREEVLSYEEYCRKHAGALDETTSAETLEVRAECPSRQSEYTIVPFSDKTSSAVSPSDPVKERLNAIGGDNWMLAGQWLAWTIHVEKAGFYKIGMRSRQNQFSGSYVTRKLYIDDEIPFEEAADIRFYYSSGWEMTIPGGDEPYLFYLEPGDHTLKLSVTLGEITQTINQVESVLSALNEDYRRILVLTGTDPDPYRNYRFEKLIPDVIEDMEAKRTELKEVSAKLAAEAGGRGERTAALDNITATLEKMVDDPYMIARYFQTFKDNLAALGSWLLTNRQSPLELDQLYVAPAHSPLPAGDGSFFSNLWFQIKALCLSFFEDYQTIGTAFTEEEKESGRVVTVWTATGRDQSQILQRLADMTFSPAKGLKVNVQLVAAGTLLPAVLAGIGPDVTISAAVGDPVNYAIRDAVVDLDRFPDYKEVIKRFHPSALTPYQYRGHSYALPETQVFPMFFYRKDIFQQIGLSVPKTWDDFYAMIPILQNNHMDIGITWQNAMNCFLYQSGGSYYNDTLDGTALDTDKVMAAFERTVELYTAYRLPVTFDFANRFRSGEMPCGIVEYTMYNQLEIFAPEIKGLWGFAPIPGTVEENGSIDNTAPSTGTAVMILKGARHYENAWEFLKWWTDTPAQSQFDVEMETVVGAAAKQPSANMEAVARMRWTMEDYTSLQLQAQQLMGTPEIPGGYYTNRALEFAFNDAYNNLENPVSMLEDNIPMVEEEIARKIREFNTVH